MGLRLIAERFIKLKAKRRPKYQSALYICLVVMDVAIHKQTL